MINTLEIKNFKSIKNLSIKCKKINIFIGGPNTGKSNILESLGVFSFGCYGSYDNVKNFVRFETLSNLFYDEEIDKGVEIKCDEVTFRLTYENGNFNWNYKNLKTNAILSNFYTDDICSGNFSFTRNLSKFKFYRFIPRNIFPRKTAEFLLPASGPNLLSLLLSNKNLKNVVREMLSPFNLRLGFRIQENKIEVLKEYEDVIISYPYSLISETLQRTIFYLAAVVSNDNSILVFEEPEAHSFPFYTKYLAEKIALDSTNQYFISTHNPYFILSILEKAKKTEIQIFITYFENYKTKIKPLNESDIEEILNLGMDVFFNLERFLK